MMQIANPVLGEQMCWAAGGEAPRPATPCRKRPGLLSRRRAVESLVVIGNGMASHKLCEGLTRRGPSSRFQLTVLGEKPCPAYNRVRGLSDLGKLVPAVEDLGRRHVGYGVRKKDYETVGAALLWTLEKGLGEAFHPEIKQAWFNAYTLRASTMQKAAARQIGLSG